MSCSNGSGSWRKDKPPKKQRPMPIIYSSTNISPLTLNAVNGPPRTVSPPLATPPLHPMYLTAVRNPLFTQLSRENPVPATPMFFLRQKQELAESIQMDAAEMTASAIANGEIAGPGASQGLERYPGGDLRHQHPTISSSMPLNPPRHFQQAPSERTWDAGAYEASSDQDGRYSGEIPMPHSSQSRQALEIPSNGGSQLQYISPNNVDQRIRDSASTDSSLFREDAYNNTGLETGVPGFPLPPPHIQTPIYMQPLSPPPGFPPPPLPLDFKNQSRRPSVTTLEQGDVPMSITSTLGEDEGAMPTKVVPMSKGGRSDYDQKEVVQPESPFFSHSEQPGSQENDIGRALTTIENGQLLFHVNPSVEGFFTDRIPGGPGILFFLSL